MVRRSGVLAFLLVGVSAASSTPAASSLDESKLVPPVQPRTLASFETRCATLTLNEAGWVISLLQKASGKEGHARELLAAPTPMVTVVVEDNRLQLRCDELGGADCRIPVRCVKVYGR